MPDDADLAAMKEKILAHNHPSAVERFYHFKPVWQRAIITAAGPIANFILAIVLFALLLGIFGEQLAIPKVMQVVPGSPAAQAGFRVGDMVKAVDGRPIRDMASLNQHVVVRARVPITFTVERGGEELQLVATPAMTEIVDPSGARQKIGQLGIEDLVTRVTGVAPGSPAEKAGLPARRRDREGRRHAGPRLRPAQQIRGLASRTAGDLPGRPRRTEHHLVAVPIMRDVADGRTVTRKVSLGLESVGGGAATSASAMGRSKPSAPARSAPGAS